MWIFAVLRLQYLNMLERQSIVCPDTLWISLQRQLQTVMCVSMISTNISATWTKPNDNKVKIACRITESLLKSPKFDAVDCQPPPIWQHSIWIVPRMSVTHNFCIVTCTTEAGYRSLGGSFVTAVVKRFMMGNFTALVRAPRHIPWRPRIAEWRRAIHIHWVKSNKAKFLTTP